MLHWQLKKLACLFKHIMQSFCYHRMGRLGGWGQRIKDLQTWRENNMHGQGFQGTFCRRHVKVGLVPLNVSKIKRISTRQEKILDLWEYTYEPRFDSSKQKGDEMVGGSATSVLLRLLHSHQPSLWGEMAAASG